MRRITHSLVLLTAAVGLVLGGLGEAVKLRGPHNGDVFGHSTNGNTAWG